MTRIACVLAAILVFASNASAQSNRGTTPLVGAWRVTEATETGTAGGTNRKPQPALLLFTEKHYSILQITSNVPRPIYKDAATISPGEALASWGPFEAQSGTYEVSGGKLTTHVLVAKNPSEMKDTDTYTFKVEGNTLMLTTATAGGAKVKNPVSYWLVREE